MKLPPHDPDGQCPKCKGEAARTIYEPRIEDDPCWYDRKYNPPGKWPEHEFLRRKCERCGYDWPEACADTKKTEAA